MFLWELKVCDMKLVFGVIDAPYQNAPSKRQRKARAGTVTTGDVAGWLENKYHVMESFWELHKDEVVGDLENAIVGAFESVVMGAPPSLDPFGSGTSKVEDRFKQFLSTGEMDRLGYPGVPTQAAIDRASGKRRSARFKRRRGKPSGGAPVSFIDTGLFQTSSKVWIE